jgi:hypothetical protein
MTDIFKTVVVTVATKTDETTAALSATGQLPATHYIATGYMPEEMIEAFADLAGADISDEEPFVALERLGLMIVSVE